MAITKEQNNQYPTKHEHPESWNPWTMIARTTHNFIDYGTRRTKRTSKDDRQKGNELND